MSDMFDKKPLSHMRQNEPLVQCITNYVAMNFAANVLAAVGASPAMTMAPEEMSDFVAISNALTVNTGTITTQSLLASQLAMKAARKHNKPIVLDPVAHFATPFRTYATHELLKLSPTLIKANASEILAFKGQSLGKGVDSKNTTEEAYESAIWLAQHQNCVVAVSGKTDFVTDGKTHFVIIGGDALMPKVSAMGCALTGLMGAYAASFKDNALMAAIYSFMTFAAAGKKAGEKAQGPGSFVVCFLDELVKLEDDDLFHLSKVNEWKKV